MISELSPVRFAVDQDFDSICALAEQIKRSLNNQAQFNWTFMHLAEELKQVKTLISESDSQITSFICFRELPDLFEISVLGTHVDWQRKHLQTQLIEYLQGLAAKQQKRILLEVHSENLKAINLYNKIGFKTVHRREKYYSDQAAALVMEWNGNKAGCGS